MDKLGEGLRSLVRDQASSGAGFSGGAADLPPTNPHLVVRSSSCFVEKIAPLAEVESRHTVSFRTCTKISLISFFAGVVVGYSLRKRFRRWVAKMLKRYSDD